MAGKAMRVEGLRGLYDRLSRLERSTAGRVLDAATLAGAEVVADDMSRRAPRSGEPGGSRGTGHAADFIGSELVDETFVKGVSVAGIGPAKSHWWLIFKELGTRLQAPFPFMRQSLDAASGDAVSQVASVLSSEIHKAAR